MESPQSLDMGEEVRISPKLPSRRKKSRPVKFNQDYILTDDLPQSSAYLSPVSTEKRPYECADTFMGTDSADFIPSGDAPPTFLSSEIQRQVTSIRDVSLLKGSAPKKIKMEDNSLNESVGLEKGPTGQQTNFSSLLHSFASQVNNRVESNEHQSLYNESPPASRTIWPVTTSSPSALPSMHQKVKAENHIQPERSMDSPSGIARQDMSFSGMLQNFVSRVNDSPTPGSTRNSPAQQPSLKSLLTIKSNPGMDSSNGGSFTGNRSRFGTQVQSFAGLLHSFASVVDRGKQESLEEKRQQLLSNQHQRTSPSSVPENAQKTSKSLLDVLHDTISRRVLETAPLPQPERIRIPESSHSTQLDKVMQFNMGIPTQAKTAGHVEGRSNLPGDSLGDSYQAQTDKVETEDELHPNGHQWSHIRNVLPPLDDTEENTRINESRPSHGDGTQHYMRKIKTELLDEEPIADYNSHPELTGYLLNDDESQVSDELDDGHLGATIKQEPMDDRSDWETAVNDVNSTLRERLLMRIGSRQSLQPSPHASTNSPSPSTETQCHQESSNSRSSPNLQSEPPANKQPLPSQTGLVSHLLSTENSSHWKSKESGSFADLLHNITSSMLEKQNKDDKLEKANYKEISIKQEPMFSEEESSHHGSAQDIGSSQDHTSSPSLTSLLQKEQRPCLKEPTDKKKVPRCVSRLQNHSQSADKKGMEFSEGKDLRAPKKRVVSYAEPPSLSTSPSVSSDDVDQTNVVDVPPHIQSKQLDRSSSRTRHANLMKHRWKRGSRYGFKIKQGWPNKRKEDLHQRLGEIRATQAVHKSNNSRTYGTSSQTNPSLAPQRFEGNETMSFTDILQRLAQKCQAGEQDPAEQASIQQNSRPAASSTYRQAEQAVLNREQVGERERSPSFIPELVSNVPSAANLKNMLLQQSPLDQGHPEAEPHSRTPSTSGTSRDVSFSNIMQDMASSVTKKRGSSPMSSTATEDLTFVDPPAPWVKSKSGNWLRFVLISQDENPKINMSVSINLWNTIHEVKIHVHHLEVPAHHWIFRRFGKRIHTTAALLGILQAISNGCSVCEGTTRGDLVHMFRNKLAPTTRWQAAALLEDSFGTSTIRSSQCELLVSGLRRSREKRCSKCSKFVDRKLKAVMYHMKKKLGIS